MKYLSFLTFCVLIFSSCQSQKNDSYGTEISTENAVEASEIKQMLTEEDTVRTTLKGTVNGVCQKKGCWMTMNIGESEEMMVTFKDYGFFVPKDCSGKKAVIEGKAFRKVTPVVELKHYAEDKGKSEEEIAAITEPKEEIRFIADGVVLISEE